MKKSGNAVYAKFDIKADLKFDYKLKCNPNDVDALTEELTKYEDAHIYNNAENGWSILEEKFYDLMISDGTLDNISIDMDDCSSDYDFKKEQIIVSAFAKANLSLITYKNEDEIEDFLNDIEFKSDNYNNLYINDYELSDYYLDEL